MTSTDSYHTNNKNCIKADTVFKTMLTRGCVGVATPNPSFTTTHEYKGM